MESISDFLFGAVIEQLLVVRDLLYGEGGERGRQAHALSCAMAASAFFISGVAANTIRSVFFAPSTCFFGSWPSSKVHSPRLCSL